MAWINAVAAVWVVCLSLVARGVDNPLTYLWFGLGAVGLVAWGMSERRGERVNIGMAAFAPTVLGILFLAGGWALEKLRRKLVAQMRTQ